MQPGTLYMIYMVNGAELIRFKKKDGPVLTTSLSVYAHSSANVTDAGWNGIANPALFHAFINANADTYYGDYSKHRSNFAQKYKPVYDSYEPIDLKDPENQLIVGAPVFVQVEKDASEVVASATWIEVAANAPRRAPRVDNAYYEVQISAGESYTDRLYLQTLEDKEDTYVIGLDLAKAGVSTKVAQMWITAIMRDSVSIRRRRRVRPLPIRWVSLFRRTEPIISLRLRRCRTIRNCMSPATAAPSGIWLTVLIPSRWIRVPTPNTVSNWFSPTLRL